MVNIRIDIPANLDPEMVPPLNFVQMCFDQNPEAQHHLNDAHAKCTSLRTRFPGDQAVLHLSGVVAYIGSNYEAAKRFWAEAVLASPGYEYSLIPLRQILEDDEFWPDAETYMEGIASGIDQVSERYLSAARQCFENHEYVEADRLGQRASALKRTSVSSLHDYAMCLKAGEESLQAGELDAWYARVVDKFQRYWQSHDADAVMHGLEVHAMVPDRIQFAKIVASQVGGQLSDTVNIFDLGCFAGINLHLVHEQLDDQQRQKVNLYGLEPNEHAVTLGNQVYPYLNLLQGTHNDLIAGTAGLPEKFDICMVSRVLMILHPDTVANIFTYLSSCTDTIIICDDIYNVDGQFSVIRSPSDLCIMHNFRNMLDDAGFGISDVIMAEVPDRECTGFVIAKNKKPEQR